MLSFCMIKRHELRAFDIIFIFTYCIVDKNGNWAGSAEQMSRCVLVFQLTCLISKANWINASDTILQKMKFNPDEARTHTLNLL